MGGALKRRAFLATLLAAGAAPALGRTPYGGTLRLSVPWPADSLDPHDLYDASAALFGHAVADPLYALDSGGKPYPTLAQGLPRETPAGTRVTLRPDLRTAHERALDGRDVVFSVRRARQAGALALLTPFALPRRDPSDALSVLFPGADPVALAAALASPLSALLPRGFSRLRPDGTGAFKARVWQRRLLLDRNLWAARGAAFLDSVDVREAKDLAEALRAFEAGDAEVGWLGSGLHQPRPGSVAFRGQPFGWVVLRTGSAAGSWSAPGVAQQLLDAIPPARLSHLALEGLAKNARGDPGWGGAPAELLVASNAPHLVQIARTLAGLLSRPGHEVTVAPRTARQLDRLRSTRRFALMLDFVRRIGPEGPATLLALFTAADPAMARRPPRLTSHDPRQLGRTLPLGVVGELVVKGAHVPGVHGLERWKLGATWRKRRD